MSQSSIVKPFQNYKLTKEIPLELDYNMSLTYVNYVANNNNNNLGI